MKKRKLFLAAILGMILFTGCQSQIEEELAGKDTEASESPASTEDHLEFTVELVPDRIDIAEYKGEYEKEMDEIRAESYANLSFQDCNAMPLRDVEKVGIYRLYSDYMGVDESIECIENWLAEIGCEDIDLEAELRDASGQYQGEGGSYPYDYPAVYDHYPDFDSGRGFFLNTNRCYIQMGDDGIYSMSDGSITAYLDLDSLAAMDALGVNEENIVEAGSLLEKNGEIWELAGGEVSVSDAAEMVKEYFEAGTPRPNPSGISVDIPEVEVFSLNDKYGYAFSMRRVYCGVPFAYTTGPRGIIYYNSDYTVDEDQKTAYVIEPDKVAAFTGYVDAELLESLTEEQTKIMRLKDAAARLSDFLAGNLRMNVQEIELVYCTCIDTDGNKIVYPCWQFDGMNTNDSQMVRAYVNVLSGDIYYYSYMEG